LDFSDFYRSEFDRVYRSAWLSARDRDLALDATQEAFTRAFARWRRLHDKPWAVGWVIKTALNLIKGRKRGSPFLPDGSPASERSPTAGRVDMTRGLSRLPIRMQTALVLRYVADLPIREIAEVMGISEGGVKSHLAQGRNALRPHLEERDA
jgi:RNA polymerase sigma-70 factor (ECF subfamily)